MFLCVYVVNVAGATSIYLTGSTDKHTFLENIPRKSAQSAVLAAYLIRLGHNMSNEPRSSHIFRLACIFIVIVLLVTSLYYLKAVLVPMLFAIIFAVMLFPFCIRLEKWGFGKGLASFTTVFVTTVFLGLLV